MTALAAQGEGGPVAERTAPHPINVRLSWADVAALDRVVGRTGYSRNEVMRLLLRIGLRHADDLPAKDTRAAIETRGPPGAAEPSAP